MHLQKLIHTFQPELSIAERTAQWPIQAVRYDSRQVQPGDLYVALPGTHSNGHDFIAAALARGARAIVCSQAWFAQQEALTDDVIWLPVSSPRQALAEIAANFYGRPGDQLCLLGVTGTNGKTTVTWLIKQLLEAQQVSCGWIGTLGAGYSGVTLPGEYTTPFAPELQAWLQQMLQAGVQAVVMECSSHALEQQRLGALPFEIAIFTNLTQDHLDYHRDMADYAAAKAKLFSESVRPEGVAIINLDDPYSHAMIAASRASVLRYSLHNPEAELYADALQMHSLGTDFVLHYRGQHYPVQLGLAGHYNVANTLAALGAVLHYGLDLTQALQTLAGVSGVPGRLERVSLPQTPFTVYVDYAHTPDSLQNVLAALRRLSTGRLIVVFGCGGDRDVSKRPLMAQAAEQGADSLVITSDNPRSEDPMAIIQGIQQGLKHPQQALIEPDRAQAIVQALRLAQPGDTVLIAGKGHEDYQIIGQKRLSFDDRQVARHWLKTHC